MAVPTVLHVDMDAFFASVEQRDHPAWRGLPVIVGAGPHERGVVSTCSYEARVFGVRSAMPSRTAYEKCPHGIFVKPRMRVYQEVSAQVFEILGHYSPFVEGVSVDEAFLDISGTVHLFGDARTLGERLRALQRHLQHVERQPLGGLHAHARQPRKLLCQPLQCGGGPAHQNSPPRFSPPVSFDMLAACSASALRSASFAAATTIS